MSRLVAPMFGAVVLVALVAVWIWSMLPYDIGDSRCGVSYSIVLSGRYDGEHSCRHEATRRSLLGVTAVVILVGGGAAVARASLKDS